MTLRMRALWAKELKVRLGKERYRTFVRINGCEAKAVDIGKGSYNRNYVADPFLFRYNDTNWLFYETLNKDGKGVLGCLKQLESGEWKQVGIVLERPWHLSYPQVFEEDGHIYMIPESCDSTRGYKEGSITLYEAHKFPYGWREVKKLIPEPLADSTLFKKDGHYYLSCLKMSPDCKAELWNAPALTGPWTKHPQSDNTNQSRRLRRNGGSFQTIDGQLYRIAQDCNGDYGKRLFKVPILDLSPTEYQEGGASLLLDSNWPTGGIRHTYNKLETAQDKIEVIDLKDYVAYPLPTRIALMLRIFLHTLFRISIKKKRGVLFQLFGVQFLCGTPKERPALMQIRIGRRHHR